MSPGRNTDETVAERPLRIIHTADWHLGRIFQGLHLTEDQAFVLEQFVDVVERAQPDVVLLAGDIYDRAVPPPDAVRLYDDVLARVVRGLQVPVIAIAGNHDSPERVDWGHDLLDASGYHVRGLVSRELAPIVLCDEHGPVYFCPLPYAEPSAVKDNIYAGAPPHALNHGLAMAALVDLLAAQVPDGARAVAIAHGAVTGAYECESERPLWVAQAGYAQPALFSRFCFTALGHFHKPQRVNVLGDDAGLVLDYPGSLLKYGFSEHDQTKSVNVIELDERGAVSLERVPLHPRRDVQLLEGSFEALAAGEPVPFPETDYLKVSLTDAQPVIDAMARLRQRFPNLLHLEQPRLYEPPPDTAATRAQMRMDESSLFAEFFREMTGAPLSDEELEAFEDVVAGIERARRGRAA
jgi:exonuclease SbcD